MRHTRWVLVGLVAVAVASAAALAITSGDDTEGTTVDVSDEHDPASDPTSAFDDDSAPAPDHVTPAPPGDDGSAEDYWTDDRMRDAEPMPFPSPGSTEPDADPPAQPHGPAGGTGGRPPAAPEK